MVTASAISAVIDEVASSVFFELESFCSIEDIMAFATCSVGVRGLVSFTASGAAFSFYYDFFSGALC